MLLSALGDLHQIRVLDSGTLGAFPLRNVRSPTPRTKLHKSHHGSMGTGRTRAVKSMYELATVDVPAIPLPHPLRYPHQHVMHKRTALLKEVLLLCAANHEKPAHGRREPPVFSFGHAATALQGAAQVHSEEVRDTQWWKKGGAPTVNQERNRDVEDFWKEAQAEHTDVSGQLREVTSALPTIPLLPLSTCPCFGS